MKEGWEYRIFESCLVKVPKQVQVKSKDYKKEGKYPIVSQEAELISGYWDDDTIVYHHQEPVVIFGDHTKNIKYNNINFVVGADGTHILSTKNDINPKFFYYVLKSIKLRELGYARHYKLLKEKYIPVPPLSEQQRIVDYLDSAFAKIDAMKANAEKALNEAKALFQASLKEMLEPKEGWEEKKVGDISEIKGGKRLPKGEKLQSEPTSHKYIRVADFNEYGTVNLDDILYISDNVYEHIKRYIIKKEDIYISIAGTIGKSGIIPEELDGANLTENACRLILSKEINQRFMYYITISPEFIRQEIESTKISAQPKLALTRLSDIIITFPPLSEQQSIVATLDSLKSKVDRLQANFEKISQECDALKQALLREVFEG